MDNLQIRRFKAAKDLESLENWLMARGLPDSYARDLPKLGFTVLYENEAIAMGFLRKCEGAHGIVDGLITDMSAPGEVRSEALDLLFKSIIGIADNRNLKILFGYTADKNTQLRASRHGFATMSHVTMSLDLAKVG